MEILNSDILKLIVLLLGIIAMAAIFLHHKPNGASIRKVHIWYLCGIGTFLLIELITWICIGNPQSDSILQTVSFASTLASLILSVVAIFITLMSNDSLLRVKDGLNDVPNKVSEAINKSLTDIQNASNGLQELVNNYNGSQLTVTTKIQEMITVLEDHVNVKMDENRQQMKDDLNAILMSTNASHQSPSDQTNNDCISDNLIKAYVDKTSYIANCIVYFADLYIASKSTSPLSIKKMSELLGFKDDKTIELYIYACIVVLSSFNLITYEMSNTSEPDEFRVSYLNNVLAECANSKVSHKLKEEKHDIAITDYINSLISETDDESEEKQ